MHKDPAEIRIVCIRVREEEGMPHDIFGLARQFGWQYDEMEPERYGGDYGYAWEIPGKYIENVVTLGRLISRGFEAFIKPMPPDFTYSKMRALFLSDIITGDPYLVGRWFCGLAKTIDICVPDIAYHLYLDCLSGGYIDETNQVFCFKSIDGSIEFRDIDYMEQHVEPSIRLGISDELSGTDPSS
jgi:hypothetical protein